MGLNRTKRAARAEILSGWKEIANYLGAGVRTVQRYEGELKLPIHRPAGKSKSRVTAIKTELDSWVKHNPVQMDVRTAQLRAQASRIGVQFLLVDADIALTLSGMALKADSAEKRERQSEAARKALDTITRLRKNLDLDEAERGKLDAKLRRLRSELHELGKRF